MSVSSAETRRRFDPHALSVACGYIVISLLWIWGSDWAVTVLARNEPDFMRLLQSIKGSAFVLSCGVGLYVAIAWANRRAAKLEHEKRLVEEMLSVSQRLEALGTLAGTLAHDFNNVLTVIRAEAEIMRLENFDANEVPHHIAAIELATKRADHMVGELMLFMRNAPATPVSGDLCFTVREVESVLRQVAGAAVQFKTRLGSGLPHVVFDRSHVERALFNLVVNAKDAVATTPEKNIVVEIALRNLAAYTSLFQPAPVTGEFVVLRVIDTGVGIPREHLVRVFSPFFTTKPPGQGTGLGLTSVLRVMQAHHGWVEVESQVGRGTVFSLYFPVQRE